MALSTDVKSIPRQRLCMHNWLVSLIGIMAFLGCGSSSNPIAYDGLIVGTWQLLAQDEAITDKPITIIFHADGRYEAIQKLNNGTNISLITTYHINVRQIQIDTLIFHFDVDAEHLILIDHNNVVLEYRRLSDTTTPLD